MSKISKGEQRIINILKQNGIQFEREKTLTDFRNGHYRFDFYLPKYNVMIEFDGEQHFKFVSRFYNKLSDFQIAKERDRRKNSYCLARNIRLYRIPYWELDKISTLSDIITNNHLVKNSFHNDLIWAEYQKHRTNSR